MAVDPRRVAERLTEVAAASVRLRSVCGEAAASVADAQQCMDDVVSQTRFRVGIAANTLQDAQIAVDQNHQQVVELLANLDELDRSITRVQGHIGQATGMIRAASDRWREEYRQALAQLEAAEAHRDVCQAEVDEVTRALKKARSEYDAAQQALDYCRDQKSGSCASERRQVEAAEARVYALAERLTMAELALADAQRAVEAAEARVARAERAVVACQSATSAIQQAARVAEQATAITGQAMDEAWYAEDADGRAAVAMRQAYEPRQRSAEAVTAAARIADEAATVAMTAAASAESAGEHATGADRTLRDKAEQLRRYDLAEGLGGR
ncbi:MAG: hypothetical protein QM621_00225 [Aeromicrobium sp.]|uniref:hypothetical protein n=1 Tax=Aeromicrobium sp. TaxID=1871063 RepID=UPI0039E54628